MLRLTVQQQQHLRCLAGWRYRQELLLLLLTAGCCWVLLLLLLLLPAEGYYKSETIAEVRLAVAHSATLDAQKRQRMHERRYARQVEALMSSAADDDFSISGW